MLDRQKEQRRKKALTILGNWAATLIKAICGALFLGVGVYLATNSASLFVCTCAKQSANMQRK
jgi:hypothetical protein